MNYTNSMNRLHTLLRTGFFLFLLFVIGACSDGLKEEQIPEPESKPDTEETTTEELTFEIEFKSIGATMAEVLIKPSIIDELYCAGIFSDADYRSIMEDYGGIDNYLQELIELILTTGTSREDAVNLISEKGNSCCKDDTLIPNTDYYVLAVGIDKLGFLTTDATWLKFKTKAEEEGKDDGEDEDDQEPEPAPIQFFSKWGATKQTVKDYMNELVLDIEEENFLFFASEVHQLVVAYEFIEDQLCTSSLMIPEKNAPEDRLQELLTPYTPLGVVDDKMVYYSEEIGE